MNDLSMILLYFVAVNASCVDKDDRCADWAKGNECSSNPSYMLKNCQKSCNQCKGWCRHHYDFLVTVTLTALRNASELMLYIT